MRRITIEYHHENNAWWTRSPDVPGFYAAADDFNTVRARTLGALDDIIDEPFLVIEDNSVHVLQGPPDTSNPAPEVTIKVTAPRV